MAESKSSETMHQITLKIPVRLLALSTWTLTSVPLAVCFVTAEIFQFDKVNHIMCGVQSCIPSISGVTGSLPQAYLWRTCIGLHSVPRFTLSMIYFNYYMSYLCVVPSTWIACYKLLVHLNFWLNVVECFCCLLIANISSTENYTVHERLVMVFFIISLLYLVLNTILFKWSHNAVMSERERQSYWWKKFIVASVVPATAGLIFFFFQLKVYCIPGSFNNFAICEYIVAYANMGNSLTSYLDFKEKYLFVGNLYQKDSSTSDANGKDNNSVEQKQL